MSSTEENLDEKIARIRRQNEAIIQRQKLIQEDIKNAERNNATVKLKTPVNENDCDEEFGPTLYSDKLSHETKILKSTPDDVWTQEERPRTRRNLPRSDKEEAWREERKRIDEERIRRQKANSGCWKREWDANKIASRDEDDNKVTSGNSDKFTRNIKNERPSDGTNQNPKESRKNNNETNDSETVNRWNNDKVNRQVNIDREIDHAYDNRKSNRTGGWRTNCSETDNFNNNGSKLDLKSRMFRFPNYQNDSFPQPSTNDSEVGRNWGIDSKHETTENIKQLSTKSRTSGDSRPMATRGSKWNRECDLPTRNQPLSFSNSPPSTRRAPKFERTDSKRNESEFNESKTSTIIPNDLKSIVIHVKNSGTKSDERKVEVKNTANWDPKYCDNSGVQNVSGNDETLERASGYTTMTFERSDLKHEVPSHYADLTSQTSIMTQMFSNSKISDFNPTIPNTNHQLDGVNYFGNGNFEKFPNIQLMAVENFPRPCNVEKINEKLKKIPNVKITRTIKNENFVLTKQPDSLKNNNYTRKSTEEIVKNTKAEICVEEGELVNEDEWEDVTDDEWEDVTDED